MKKIYLLLSIIFIISCRQEHKPKKYLGLNGKVEQVREKRFDIEEKFGEIIEDELEGVAVYSIDNQGFLVEYTYYNSRGEEVYKNKRKFEGGKCIEISNKSKYSDGLRVQKLKERGSNYEIWEITSTDTEDTETYRIDKKNLLHTTVWKDNEGNITSRTEERFDKQGNLIEYKAFGEDERVTYWFKTKYEKNQEIKREILEDFEKGVFTFKYVEFDEKGNWIKRIEYIDDAPEAICVREITYRK